MKRFEFMIRGAITSLAALGLLVMCSLASAQTVVITVNPASAKANGVDLCATTPMLGMDPSGGLTVTCTPATTGGGTTNVAPSCTVSSTSVTIPSGATTISSATIGSVCFGNPVPTVQWTNTDGAAGFSNLTGASITGGPLGAGTFHFSLVASNGVGSPATASGILTVNPASAGGGTSGCPATPVNSVFSGIFSGDHPTIITGGFASYVLPTFTAASNTYMGFTAVESNNTISGLRIEYAVSPCVGDFTSASMPPFCTAYGTANSGIAMNAYEGNTGVLTGASVCIMQPNTQYYLNVRAVKPDGTNSCPASSCSLYVQYRPYPF